MDKERNKVLHRDTETENRTNEHEVLNTLAAWHPFVALFISVGTPFALLCSFSVPENFISICSPS